MQFNIFTPKDVRAYWSYLGKFMKRNNVFYFKLAYNLLICVVKFNIYFWTSSFQSLTHDHWSHAVGGTHKAMQLIALL